MIILLLVALASAATTFIFAVRWRRALLASRAALAGVQQAANDRLEQMAVTSHEIRTPLALIVGPVELLLEETPGPLTETQRTFLHTVRANVTHLQSITEDVLAQSRIEAGMFTMQEGVVDLRTLGMRAVEELRELQALPIAFDCPGQPPLVRGDARLLLQAITNLLTNACRHSQGRVVLLRLRRQTRNTLVSVDDSGIGMTRQQRRAAFMPYTTGASATGGVGLGMVITKEIVRLHGGTLHVQTVPGSGTTMMFALRNADTATDPAVEDR